MNCIVRCAGVDYRIACEPNDVIQAMMETGGERFVSLARSVADRTVCDDCSAVIEVVYREGPVVHLSRVHIESIS